MIADKNLTLFEQLSTTPILIWRGLRELVKGGPVWPIHFENNIALITYSNLSSNGIKITTPEELLLVCAPSTVDKVNAFLFFFCNY